MRRLIGGVAALLAWTALTAVPARGQDQGNAPNWRDGAVWQSEIDLAKEVLREMEAELSGLDLDAWKDRSVAWIEIAAAADGGAEYLAVPSSWHVGGLDAGRKVEVELESEYDPEPKWQLRYDKKRPRSVTLVLTDEQATRVDCSLVELVEGAATGHLGVFVHAESNTVHCVPRPAAG